MANSAVTERRRTLQADLDRIGPLRFALLAAVAIFSLLWLAGGVGSSLWWHPPGLVNALGGNIGRDFVSFWAASAQALAGDPAAAWDRVAHGAVERQAIGAPVGFYAWFYPPSFLALVLPLALMPYPVALGLWLATPALLLVWLLRRVAPGVMAPLAALLFPGTAQCLISGQNGLVSAVFLTGGLAMLETRPAFAGLCLGALSYKPQLAAGAFVALLCGRHWHALSAACASAAALALLSLCLFGPESWAAFLHDVPIARSALENGDIPWSRMSAVFPAARLAGLGIAAASSLQAAVSLPALAALAWAWRRGHPLKGAALAAAMPLLTPFVYDYDLPILLPAMLMLVSAGLDHGFRRGEAALLVMVWLNPALSWLIADRWHVQLMPWVLAAFLIAVLTRREAGATGPRGAMRG